MIAPDTTVTAAGWLPRADVCVRHRVVETGNLSDTIPGEPANG